MSGSARFVAELRGPIHGRIAVLRGMCMDERSYSEIDARLAALDDLVIRLSETIENLTPKENE